MYWDNFYKTFSVQTPSDFCIFILKYFPTKQTILDCGCGNGRDSIAMAQTHSVDGIDLSASDPFICGDFCTVDKSKYSLIYSRFTFHSITNEDHGVFLNSITIPGTFLCIETRSDKDKISFRHHGDDHYRNFTNVDYLTNLLIRYNFKILYLKESNNLAIYKNENPICIRIICKKN